METIKKIGRNLCNIEVKRGRVHNGIVLSLSSEIFEEHFKAITRQQDIRAYTSCRLYIPQTMSISRVNEWSFLCDPEGNNALFHGDLVNMCYIRAVGIGSGITIKINPQLISTERLQEWAKKFSQGCSYYYQQVIKPVTIISRMTVEEMVVQ